jgi:hypothetical protein
MTEMSSEFQEALLELIFAPSDVIASATDVSDIDIQVVADCKSNAPFPSSTGAAEKQHGLSDALKQNRIMDPARAPAESTQCMLLKLMTSFDPQLKRTAEEFVFQLCACDGG